MLALLIAATLAQGPVWPVTRAELTNYKETSHYEDVMDFLTKLKACGAPMDISHLATSTEGRDIPLVIMAKPMVHTAAEAKASGKPIVYIEANIHAGEVEGKEAILMIMRDYAKNNDAILDKTILMIAPDYNADGNEKFGPQEKNRGGQNGPEMVGVRANGAGLDLNRDCIKAESPEMCGVLAHVYGWDPDVILDLHTTDGTRHAYQLTYAPGLYPNLNKDIMRYTRDQLIPEIRNSVAKDGLRLFDYGNAEKVGDTNAWASFECYGRYVTNYASVRNRIAILSEAMTHCPFDERVKDTYRFVDEILKRLVRDSKHVIAMTRAADAQVVAWGNDPSKAPALGIRWQLASRGLEEVLLEDGPAPADPKTPITKWKGVKIPVFDRFTASKKAAFPAAYLIPFDCENVVNLLSHHGIDVTTVKRNWTADAQGFTVSDSLVAGRAFQGHKLVTLDGSFAQEQINDGGKRWYILKTAQPLGVLAFDMLEPEGLDGVLAWGLLGDKWVVGDKYPIYKVMRLSDLKTGI